VAATVTRVVHPIEVRSYEILRSRLRLEHLPPLTRAVAERVVHTTADTSWAGEVLTDEAALRAGRAALLAGAELVVDARMVAAGVTSRASSVVLDEPGVAELAAAEGLTRSAAGVRLAARRVPAGAVWAVGNAPTALQELLRLAAAGELSPALVVGVPVGFVGAVESKAALRASGLPSVSTPGERGGTPVAVAVLNALLYTDLTDTDPTDTDPEAPA
jgi:precorrin-8X/cobalt-precorrin-8 methylmutase